MMKKLTYIFLLTCAIGFAQNPITKKLGDFHTVKVYNGLTVELEKSNKSSIEIIGSKAHDVVIKNSDGILKIRLQFPESFTADDVRIVLKCKSLDVIDANEGAKIVSDRTIKQQHLEVKVQEGAHINLDIKTKHLIVKSVSGGIVELSGSTENQNVEATTGGIYESYELKSSRTIVLAASGARTEVNASEVLDAKVRFGGTIHYKGNPEVLKTKKIVGGKIRDKN